MPDFFQLPFAHEVHMPESALPSPLIFITPLLGRLILFEDLFFERHFARYFARRGFAVCLIHRPIFNYDPRQGLEQIGDYLETSIERNAAVLNSVLQDPRIDKKNIGTLGISFGSVIHVLWAENEKRIKAHVFALTGGNLPEIFLSSRDPLMLSYLRATEKATGLSGKSLAPKLRKIFPRDPLTAAKSIPAKDTLLILGRFDRVIRFQYGLTFSKALGNPRTITLPLGHYLSMLATPLLKRAALNFFNQKLRK